MNSCAFTNRTMSDNLNKRKRELLQRLMEDEEEDDEIMLLLLASEKRKKIDSLYTSRVDEGSYNILIKRHFNLKEEKFRKYCRLNKAQFKFVLSLIENDIQPKKKGSRLRKNYF